MKAGKLIIISGPSGVGKGTIIKQLLQQVDNLVLSVSTTTRDMRPGEVNGREYWFVTQPEFDIILKREGFLEWAEVHGSKYGTTKDFVLKQVQAGLNVVLEIDTQGRAQIVSQDLGDIATVSIFIESPSMAELEQRLKRRSTEDAESMALRLSTAEQELAVKDTYDKVIMNDDLAAAIKEVCSYLKSVL